MSYSTQFSLLRRCLFPALIAAISLSAALPGLSATPGGEISTRAAATSPASLPLLLGLSPATATAGGNTSFLLTVSGSNFASNAQVLWNGVPLATTYVSGTRLTATVPASNIAIAGTALVTVANPAPQAATSSAIPFAVMASQPVATVLSASLANAADGSGNHQLGLTGMQFVTGSLVEWNGTSVASAYVNPWQLAAVVSSAEFGSLPAEMLVFNPAGDSVGFELSPVVLLSPSTSLLGFSAVAGGSNPANQSFTVSQTNGGAPAQALSISSDSAWLTATPATGSAAYGTPQTVTAGITLGSLTVGLYTGHITITGPEDTGSPLTITVTLSVNAVGTPTVQVHPDLRRRVIYQIITDRFFNHDTSTENPPQSSGMFDATKTNWQDYWGGNLAGIQAKLPYLQALGVGAIWISPPVDNINVSNNGYAPYHGYSGHDYKRIDEHYGNVDNSWTAFDNLVAAAHAANIQVIIDFAGNDSNPRNGAEYGALYDDGLTNKLTDYNSDAATVGSSPTGTGSYYHHNANINSWSDRYQLQYGTLVDLSDFAQESAPVDKYLKDSLNTFLQHGVDGFRLDAVKHTNWGWEYTEQNSIQSYASSAPDYVNPSIAAAPYVFGEWYEGLGDSLYPDSYKWSNNSGIAILNYPLYYDVSSAFSGGGANFYTIDNDISTEQGNFASVNDLPMFIDNHDQPRLLSKGATQNQLNEALVFDIACSGIPIVYYGDEQYLHNDTSGGGDPYTRVWMSSFDTTTTAAKAVRYMAALRSSNPALAYGGMAQRWKNNDIYIFERVFNSNIVLVAINKNESTSTLASGLYTALPAGTYQDYLNGMLGGQPITVIAGGSSGNQVYPVITLPPHSVSVWQVTSNTSPQAGAVTPRMASPGTHVAITGTGFGSAQGTVTLGGTAVSIVSWADDTVVFTVPPTATLSAGSHAIAMSTAASTAVTVPSSFNFITQEATLIPVTFTLHGAPALTGSDQYYITGNTVELGSNKADVNHAFGPLLIPTNFTTNNPTGADPLITVPMPAGVAVQFKFIKLPSGITESSTHSYTAPTSGTDAQTINW